MPGWSLWLVPPADSPLNAACDELICSTLPNFLPAGVQSHPFAPHVTLSSHIPASTVGSSAADFLDALSLDDFSKRAVHVHFAGVERGTAFFKKVYLQCERDAGLVALAERCREAGVLGGDAAKAAQWAESEYDPHFSLVYADLEVDLAMMQKTEQALDAAGVESRGQASGWVGGRVWLVPTEKAIKDWAPIAERTL